MPPKAQVIVDVKKLKEIQNQLPENVDRYLGHGLALPTEARAKISMAGSKTGRWYRIQVGDRSWVMHRASAEGEAPAIVTGTLRSSIQAKRLKFAEIWIVNAGTEYAAILEFGRVGMGARPFMRPAAYESVDKRPSLADVLEGKID